MPLFYVNGDATCPNNVQGETAHILHICNDMGIWGRGFVVSLSARWEKPEAVYRDSRSWTLGDINFIPVTENIVVVNMIAQHRIRGHTQDGLPPIRYGALGKCLKRVADNLRGKAVSIHMPRIGTGLAGGEWPIIERLIEKELADFNVTVYFQK